MENSSIKSGFCRRCGNCCRYHIFEPWQFKYDMEWLKVRQGWMHGRLAVVPTLPCQHLDGNDCTLHDKLPPFCEDYPGKQEDCIPEWLEAMGCKFFEEELNESQAERSIETS